SGRRRCGRADTDCCGCAGCAAPVVTAWPTVKIASWNVNSIRARQQGLITWLSEAQPDVLCLQELKCLDDEFPALDVKVAGYDSACYGQRSYNGVAIVSTSKLSDVKRGFEDELSDGQSRVIAATVGGVRVLSVYAPNGQSVDSEAFRYKLEWYERLRRHLD